MVADHEGGAVLPEQPVDRLTEPALVSELEAVPPRGQDAQRTRQKLLVASEVGRELPDDRPELLGANEWLDPLVITSDPLLDLAQPPDVGQVAARLGGEQEILWGVLDPARHGIARREAIEGRVDLDRVEHLGVAREPARLPQSLRI